MSTLLKELNGSEFIKNPKHREVYNRYVTGKDENDRLSASIVKIMPGGEIIPHTHEVLEVFYILEGEGMALVNGERKPAGSGSVIIAPPGEEHGVLNTGEKEILMYAVFSPGIA